jgi:hypothetical protein
VAFIEPDLPRPRDGNGPGGMLNMLFGDSSVYDNVAGLGFRGPRIISWRHSAVHAMALTP